ncbi:MAG: hypothetical protein H6597_02770 [Flavobacteriales bacterium]|nr:hypothetical protein [Flavobacteriales bacterium]MCB9193429.1 hypothetical protein [Flavobacteriales bacterium]
MNDKMSGLIGRVAQWALGLLGILFVIMIYLGKTSGIDGGLYITYAAFFLCAGLAVLFALYSLVTSGKRALPTLIGVGVFLVLLAIAYAMSSDAVLPEWGKMGVTAGESKWIGAGLGVLYIMMGGTVLAILAGEVSRFFK